jgi:hypothetical protein
MTLNPKICLKIPKIHLPKPSINHQKWAVIACDQFTSEPDYWQDVEEIIGDSPSTYHMILPEVYLGTPKEEQRVKTTQTTMKKYLDAGIFRQVDDFIYIHRKLNDHTRRGLMVCLDLEDYDYQICAQTLIRATEGTIIDRLPPRIRIREKALLECPHILVLFDDPGDTVFGPLEDQLSTFNKVYDFELMLGSGHLTGFALNNDETRENTLQALKALINPETFENKYNLKPGIHQPLLFAMGDGNHSLATAKAIWEKIKPSVSMEHPSRYALVEIENIHDPALTFEPIHRLLFNLNKDVLQAMRVFWGNRLKVQAVASEQDMITIVDQAAEPWHQIGMVSPQGPKLVAVHNPTDNLPVGTLQKFLNTFMADEGAEQIDYVHGTKVLFEKGKSPGNTGFYVPGMDKSELFRTVILDGALPRKTFSMGEAKEKRFYMECRQIQSA